MGVNQKVLDAIELLTNSSIQKAGYDKTIRAQIVSYEDPATGKYKCKYQDATFYAYANDLNASYSKNTNVYILVPENDMDKEKTILGSISNLGMNYISEGTGEQLYNINGTNCVSSNNIFWLDTINKNYKFKIYDCNNVNGSQLKFNATAVNQYIKQSSSIIVGSTITTTIPIERRSRGHYGLIFNLKFKDNLGQEVIRSYILDEDHMSGDPYKLLTPTRQYEIFDIDGQNFIRIESVEIFNTQFPNANQITSDLLTSGDIKLEKIELMGATRMKQTEINGIAISFYTPNGTFFLPNSTTNDKKTITAHVKIKGKLASNTSKISFYWGVQNVGILTNSEYYNKYLGKGWKCLNNKNIIKAATITEDPIIEWISGTDTYIMNFVDATARDNRVKVAIIYEENVVTKQINIQNLANTAPILNIVSDSGTLFHNDIGLPNLTCSCIKNNQNITDNCTYYWGYEDNNGIFQELPQTTELNTDYNNKANLLKNLKNAIENETAFLNASQQQINEYQTYLENLKYYQRVDKNNVFNVQISNITNFGIFKCSVYDSNKVYLGTASLKIINTSENQDGFSLVINHGNQVFQYNENGVAPNNKSLDKPQQIEALTFSIFDKTGQELDTDLLIRSGDCDVQWKFPIVDTLLVKKISTFETHQNDNENIYYKNVSTLTFDIEQKYDFKKNRNQIGLTIKYKGNTLTAQTDFTFIKQGEVGTNGTDYTIKLVPNTKKPFVYLPTITRISSDGSYRINYGLDSVLDQVTIVAGTQYSLFNVQLWKQGDRIWRGRWHTTAAADGLATSRPSAVNFQMLTNKYSSNVSDTTSFQINTGNNNISYNGNNFTINTTIENYSVPLANILKCTLVYNNKNYYATLPIATAWVVNDNYRIELKEYTGFKYVMYSSDGLYPEYDNSKPFEFILKKKINGVWEDVSLMTTNKNDNNRELTFNFFVCGNTKTVNGNITILNDSNNLEILTNQTFYGTLQKNQCLCRPSARYNGECVNNALICEVRRKDNNGLLARMTVPIHFLLNKYGLAQLNQWDGNNIKIDNEGGYILSPQVGAGKKNNDNTFTGILMGELKLPDRNPNVGLFGFNKGERTIFLNSENGSAIFGKSGNGQITLDPVANQALLYSSNFWKNYNINTGLPENYNLTNENGQGLIINLTKPEIRYGNGKFKVDENGNLTATNANISGTIAATSGKIGNWSINQHELKAGDLFLNYDGSIYSGTHSSFTSTANGFFINKDGFSIGSKFKVDKNGDLTASNADLTGGKIGGWVINARELKAENGSGGYISLDYEGSMSGPNWSIGANGAARFTYITALGGNIGAGNSLIGNGFTFGGSASTIYPNSIVSGPVTSTTGNSLSGVLHGEFDTISARQAAIGTVNAGIVRIDGELTTTKNSITNINSKITSINSSITSINGDITNLNSDIININGDITNLDSDITNINGRLTVGDRPARFIDVVSQITGVTVSRYNNGTGQVLQVFVNYRVAQALGGFVYAPNDEDSKDDWIYI